MAGIVYTEYESRHAKAVATMWNNSTEGWMGRAWNSSEAKVLQEQQTSPYLNLYLAFEGEAVVGYARLCEYGYEANVAYVEMLNVLPSHHGRGIGKALIRLCVKRAAELGYGRIDLFTWPGNLKAMPLYKKCGFFWEQLDSWGTHLMNFLPGLLRSELLKPLLERFDLYADFKRELSMVPDGRKVKGFDLFDHRWEKDGQFLEVTVERQGRGVVAIRTNEWSIEAETDDPEPVFGLEYPITYKLENHTNLPLAVSLRGKNEAELVHGLDFSGEVETSLAIPSLFRVDPIQKQRTDWESMPGVLCEIAVNGRSQLFKTGLKLEYPLDLELRNEHGQVLPGRESRMWLNARNNFPRQASFDLELPEQPEIRLRERKFSFSLEAGERRMLPLDFTVDAALVYAPAIKVKASAEGSAGVEFEKQASVCQKVCGSSAAAILPTGYYLLSGLYELRFETWWQVNRGWFGGDNAPSFYTMPPQAGMPYSEEFENLAPWDARLTRRGEGRQLELSYRSQDKPGLEFALLYTLYPGGLLEYRARALKVPDGGEYGLLLRVTFDGEPLSYKSGGRILSLEEDMLDVWVDDLPQPDPDCNWLFSRQESGTLAIIWEPSAQVGFENWFIGWKINLAELARSGKRETEPLRVYLNCFGNSMEVRDFARNTHLPAEREHPTLELVANGGNPCVSGSCPLELVLRQNQMLHGRVTFGTAGEGKLSERELRLEDESQSLTEELHLKGREPLQTVWCELARPSQTLRREETLLLCSGQVRQTVEELQISELLRVDNGVLSFAAPREACLPSIVSLSHAGVEWLDSGYPDFAPKGHFNPYLGGLYCIPTHTGLQGLRREQHRAEFSELVDNWGNLWSGLAIRTEIKENKALRGMVFRQHFLTRPGLPLLVAQTEILASYGKAEYCGFKLNLSLKPAADMGSCFVELPLKSGVWDRIRGGENDFRYSRDFRHTKAGAAHLPHRLHLLSQRKRRFDFQLSPELFWQNVYLYSEILAKVPQYLRPLFVVFAPPELEHSSCSQLLALSFRQS